MSASSATRARRIAEGKCAVCLRRDRTPHRATCQRCRDRMRVYVAGRYAARRQRVCCVRCDQPATGYLCTRCQKLRQRANRRVYFVRGGDTIKIGSSRNVRVRLRALQASSPITLTVIATVRGGERLERDLHRKLIAWRLHGEWYQASPEVLAEIAAVIGGGAR